MATMITSECINCGACEPECPNTAIYQGGVEWELNGEKHPALAQDLFYIVPEKCTECVGFYDHEACAAVCPVDCCIPNPDIPETEEQLIARARVLHPDKEFGTDVPSRFRAGNGMAKEAAVAPAPSLEPPAVVAAPAKPAAAPDPAAAPPSKSAAPAAAPAPKAAPAPAPKSATPARIEKPLVPPKPRQPRPEKAIPEELPVSFEEAQTLLKMERGGKPAALKWIVALAQPVLGALPPAHKQAIERLVGDPRFFSVAGATGFNAMLNMLLYPMICAAVGALVLERDVFSDQLKYLLFLGFSIASVETFLRMREGFQGQPVESIRYRAAFYALPLLPFGTALLRRLGGGEQRGTVGQDGFRDARFDEKIERERRYGEVYRLREENNGFFLELEFPRRVPRSSIKEELGIPDEMPDYDYELTAHNGYFIVKGKVVDPDLRKVAAVSPAFPPDFMTQIKLPAPIVGFKHRFRDKTLEVALIKRL